MSESKGLGIDWTSDEAVVRAKWPDARECFDFGGYICSKQAAISFGQSSAYADLELGSGYAGEDARDYREVWSSARQHPTVQAFERTHRPQEIPERPFGPENCGFAQMDVEMDKLVAELGAVPEADKAVESGAGEEDSIDLENELPEFKAEWEPHVEACAENIRYLANDQVLRLKIAAVDEAARRFFAPVKAAVDEPLWADVKLLLDSWPSMEPINVANEGVLLLRLLWKARASLSGKDKKHGM